MPKASNTHHSKSIRPWCNRWIKIKVLTLVGGSHSTYVIVLLFGKYMFCLHNTLRSWPAPLSLTKIQSEPDTENTKPERRYAKLQTCRHKHKITRRANNPYSRQRAVSQLLQLAYEILTPTVLYTQLGFACMQTNTTCGNIIGSMIPSNSGLS